MAKAKCNREKINTLAGEIKVKLAQIGLELAREDPPEGVSLPVRNAVTEMEAVQIALKGVSTQA